MSPTDITELRRLHRAATKGEWSVMIDEHETEEDGTVIAGEIAIPEINRMLHSTEWADSSDWQRDLDNAEFIAAAHNALPALLDELEAAREDSSRLDFLAKSSRLTPAQVSGIVNGFRYKRVKYADIRAATDAAMEDS